MVNLGTYLLEPMCFDKKKNTKNFIEPNSVYVLILTRSRLGLLTVIYCKFAAEVCPLVEVDWDFHA